MTTSYSPRGSSRAPSFSTAAFWASWRAATATSPAKGTQRAAAHSPTGPAPTTIRSYSMISRSLAVSFMRILVYSAKLLIISVRRGSRHARIAKLWTGNALTDNI